MDSIRVGADELTFQVTSETLLAVEVRMPPGGGPPGLHRHAPDELYRGERGEFTIYLEDERIPLGPGDVVHIPGGVAHTVRNESGEEALAYVVFSPGAEMEAFVRAAAALDDPAGVRPLAERHGIEFV
ncbi:cupin domain-containing protein [Solirubrobacter taibaiensis]|nr:cupin domain-containing protein [Solirubrobacter taibaiensis]